MNAVRLPLRFDPARLQADLGRIGPDEWVAHFNRGEYEGDWSGVALRAVDGRADQIYPDPTATARYADTPLLARCPYLREVLAAIRCPLTAVRLLRLAPRSSIREHRDYKLAHEHGEARLHIPVVTNERVAFFLAGARVPMAAGETWYLNLELPHRVDNQSDVARVHLLVDCLVNPWLDALLAPALAVVPAARQPTAPRPVARRDTPFGHPTTAAIAGFLRAIGLEVAAGSAPERTVVPGIWIEQGALLVDEARLLFPGDLLHEAGHLAVMAPLRRAQATGDVGGDPAEEMLAIAWSASRRRWCSTRRATAAGRRSCWRTSPRAATSRCRCCSGSAWPTTRRRRGSRARSPTRGCASGCATRRRAEANDNQSFT
jgi:hypothetical protein